MKLLAKVFDHAKHAYKFGFRMLTLGWSDGTTFLPVNSVLLLTENKKNRMNEADSVDKRTVGYRRRQLAIQKGTTVMLKPLKQAKKAAIPAKYVLFDSWFSSPASIFYLCIISTDTELDENESIRIYGKRWDIEVFFKVCKSYLHLSKECRSMSYDAMTAHTAVVFTRYMMLSIENRESQDERSLGELFLYFSNEMSDITWIQAFQLLLQMFRALLADNINIAEEEIDKLVDTFMDAVPTLLNSKLQAA